MIIFGRGICFVLWSCRRLASTVGEADVHTGLRNNVYVSGSLAFNGCSFARS